MISACSDGIQKGTVGCEGQKEYEHGVRKASLLFFGGSWKKGTTTNSVCSLFVVGTICEQLVSLGVASFGEEHHKQLARDTRMTSLLRVCADTHNNTPDNNRTFVGVVLTFKFCKGLLFFISGSTPLSIGDMLDGKTETVEAMVLLVGMMRCSDQILRRIRVFSKL